MKAIFSILNKVIKSSSKIKASEQVLRSNPAMFVSNPVRSADTFNLAETIAGKFNMSVCDFPKMTKNYQSAIQTNSEDLSVLFDLVKTGEVSKESALKEIFEILNKSYGVKTVPKVKTGYRGAYAEYREFLNKIDVNETLSMDEIIAHYSHEFQHYRQAIDINKAVSLNDKFKNIALTESKNLSFRTLEEKETFISKRVKELEKLHKDAGWEKILSETQVDNSSIMRGRELYKSDLVPYHTQNHLGEIESYTAGTSTYIELQNSVHKSITKKEYEILNEINIVLHENYCNLSDDLKKLTVSINVNPESFVNNIKYAVREIGITDAERIIKEFLVPLANM